LPLLGRVDWHRFASDPRTLDRISPRHETSSSGSFDFYGLTISLVIYLAKGGPKSGDAITIEVTLALLVSAERFYGARG
jgi:hypothetical protein